MVSVKRPATYADIQALPEHMVGEIIDGILYASPRPRSRHARVAGRALGQLDGSFDMGGNGPGGWWLLPEPELHLGKIVVVPDIAGWRRDRLPALPDVAYFEIAPNWVCEVASPSTVRLDRGAKMAAYARHGVDYLWLIDAIARTLETYRREGEHWLLLRTFVDDEPVRGEPFDAVELSMTPWWLPEPQPPTP